MTECVLRTWGGRLSRDVENGPSSSYLSDPLNSYNHLGVQNPFVYPIVSRLRLDSRIGGSSTRFGLNGCRPNAVLRPFLCPQSQQDRGFKANEGVVLGSPSFPGTNQNT